VVLGLVGGAPAARAEDPAEILPYLNVAGPSQAPGAAVSQRLRQATERAAAAGVPVKVALIRTAEDLEGATDFVGRPSAYAHALGRQISYYFAGQVVVAMPDGLGTAGPLPAALVRRALAGVRVDCRGSPDDLARAATIAVNRLVAAAPKPAAGGGGSGWLVPGIAVAAAAAVLGAIGVVRRRGRERNRAEEPT
jgi:hypothetical protein